MTTECPSLVEQATPGCDVMPGPRGDVHESEATVPRALLASGIPRIVILDENAVYDHYMRRLNTVWMRRIKVCILYDECSKPVVWQPCVHRVDLCVFSSEPSRSLLALRLQQPNSWRLRTSGSVSQQLGVAPSVCPGAAIRS